MSSLALFPGIRYDPREPPPPGLDSGYINAHFVHAGHGGREPDALPPWGSRSHADSSRQRNWGVGGAAEVGKHAQEPPKEGLLSPLSTSVKAQVIQDTAKFTVTQVFGNKSHDIQQAVYQFPLPLDATVTGFDCRIGPNKIVRGKVKAREDARREFDDARRWGRTGGLMEQQTAEIFTITLANIPSHTKIQAELSFMCLLKHRVEADHQVFTLTLPTFIAPRYGDAPPGIRISTQGSRFLSVGVDVLTVEDLLSVKSETHAIKYSMGAGPKPCQTWDAFISGHDNDVASPRAATVELEDRLTSLDKDLVIAINTALSDNAEAPQACLETHPTLENHQALMLTLPPELMTATANSTNDGEIIFLADRSGSMDDKINSLKSAMLFFINGIPRGRRFNIWCFGSEHTSLWPQSRRLDEASRQEAMAYVRDEFASDMGGTEILPPLKEICNATGDHRTMDVIVLTDGEVWSAPETIGFVRSRRVISKGAARFFSLGIGHAVSHELVEGIAKAGGGYAEVITSASSGGWEDRVVTVLKAATTSHIGRLSMRLEWEEQDNLGPPSNFKQSPVDVSNLSPFLRNRIFLLFDSGEKHPRLKHIVLQVQNPDGSIIKKAVLPKRLRQPDTLIHKLAVRALLGDLERGESSLHRAWGDRGSYTDDLMIRAEAIELGCKWSLVSRWTSVYAVEEEAEVPNEAMMMEMETPEASDELEDALLLGRGGRAAANLMLRLPRPGAVAEENGRLFLDSHSAGQSSTGNSSDDDSYDDANGPGFNSNTGHDTNSGSGRASNSHSRVEQPGERQASPDILTTHGQSRKADPLQPGDELPSGVTRHPPSWNPTPGPEYVASPGAQLPSPPRGRRKRKWKNIQSYAKYAPHKSSVMNMASQRRFSLSSSPPRSVSSKSRSVLNSVPPSKHTLPTSHPSVQHAIDYNDPSPISSDAPQVADVPAPHIHSALSCNDEELLQVIPLSSSSDMPENIRLHTNLEREIGARSSSCDLMSILVPQFLSSAEFFIPPQAVQDFGIIDPSEPPSPAASMVHPPTNYDLYAPSKSNAAQDLVPDIPVTLQQRTPPVFQPPSFGYNSTSAAASTPIFNPPASTSLVRDFSSAAKAPDELAAEKFIRQLVLLQLSDGRFCFSDDDSVKATLGLPFMCLVARLKSKLIAFDLAVTIAIVALLEEQFQGCRDLWALMVRKAADYITRCNLGPIGEELEQESRQGVKSMGSVMKEVKDGEVAIEAVTELENAPIS
ncbi:hypothetical protein ACJ41O_014364 [Fusarium nematophilum]